jgi:hypothetical protein
VRTEKAHASSLFNYPRGQYVLAHGVPRDQSASCLPALPNATTGPGKRHRSVRLAKKKTHPVAVPDSGRSLLTFWYL